MDLIFLFLEVVVKYFYGSPHVLFVFENWRQGMSLIRPCLAVIYPLFNRFIFLPSVVTGECFDARHIGVTVKDFILLFEYFESLLRSFVLVGCSIQLFDEGPFSDDVFVLFNNISMSGREALF